jgi:hypothetical protein
MDYKALRSSTQGLFEGSLRFYTESSTEPITVVPTEGDQAADDAT